MTKLTWDNAALVSPKTAEKFGISHDVAWRGGEHGKIYSNVIDIALSNSKVTAAAWRLPGQADGVVVLPLGYGRKRAGYTGTNKGFNAYAVRTSNALWTATGGKITKTATIILLLARNITSTWKAPNPGDWDTRGVQEESGLRSRTRRATAKRTFALQGICIPGYAWAWPLI